MNWGLLAAVAGALIMAMLAASLIEWRLRAHLGDTKGLTTALRAHVDSFDSTWRAVNGRVDTVSERVDVLRIDVDDIRETLVHQKKAIDRIGGKAM